MSQSKPSLAEVLKQMVSMFERMPAVVELPDGAFWREMTEPGDAITIGNTSHSEMAKLYEKEAYLEGGHPRRWFVLMDKPEGRNRCALVVSVLPEDKVESGGLSIPAVHVSWGRKQDVEENFVTQIEELAAATGIDFGRAAANR